MRKQGKRSWFDILTTLWAVALLVVAVTWVASPVFAGDGGSDCVALCVDEGFCDDAGGCKNGRYEGGQCGGDCEEGGEWTCEVGDV